MSTWHYEQALFPNHLPIRPHPEGRTPSIYCPASKYACSHQFRSRMLHLVPRLRRPCNPVSGQVRLTASLLCPKIGSGRHSGMEQAAIDASMTCVATIANIRRSLGGTKMLREAMRRHKADVISPEGGLSHRFFVPRNFYCRLRSVTTR
jgi:hypothetical protein